VFSIPLVIVPSIRLESATTMSPKHEVVSREQVEKSIVLIRGLKVMLDSDLARLYGVSVKRLNEQVRRNRRRFPSDFMIRLTREEHVGLRSQIATLNPGRGEYRKYPPYAFTSWTEIGIRLAALFEAFDYERTEEKEPIEWHQRAINHPYGDVTELFLNLAQQQVNVLLRSEKPLTLDLQAEQFFSTIVAKYNCGSRYGLCLLAQRLRWMEAVSSKFAPLLLSTFDWAQGGNGHWLHGPDIFGAIRYPQA
jgi:hypothetical protein